MNGQAVNVEQMSDRDLARNLQGLYAQLMQTQANILVISNELDRRDKMVQPNEQPKA
jgi:hypothetical protein